ncbi:MAG: hypothetical protein CME70_02550 [Halobacteriovorax sp.]|nr:hypothetical protein [Halobacteriovorax sp.]
MIKLLLPLLLLISSCGITPIKREVELPPQELKFDNIPEGKSRVVIYNSSNWWTHGIDQTGHLNVKLNGKGLGRVDMEKYLVVDATKGKNKIELAHRDILTFNSEHNLDFNKDKHFLSIYATAISSKAVMTDITPETVLLDYKPNPPKSFLK